METTEKKITVQCVRQPIYILSLILGGAISLACVITFYYFFIPHISEYLKLIENISKLSDVFLVLLIISLVNPLTLCFLCLYVTWAAGAICWKLQKKPCTLAVEGETLKIQPTFKEFRVGLPNVERISYSGLSTPLFQKRSDTIVTDHIVGPEFARGPSAYHFQVNERDEFAYTDANAAPASFHHFTVLTASEKIKIFIPYMPMTKKETADDIGRLESLVRYILSLNLSDFHVYGTRHGVTMEKAERQNEK